MVAKVWSQDWSTLDDYQGLNASMHAVEAMLAAHDVTGEAQRARSRDAGRRARAGLRPRPRWLPEHFTSGWRPVLDFNQDQPADPFRPYGATIGHLLEWSRLTLHLRTPPSGRPPPPGCSATHAACSTRRWRVGWAVDGVEGFVYTTDLPVGPWCAPAALGGGRGDRGGLGALGGDR